jgi:uncharacterized RDD family membrane protein YckC
MTTPNPYAPPASDVQDIYDPTAPQELADRGTRLAAMVIDSLIIGAMWYGPFLIALIINATISGTTGENVNALMMLGTALGAAGFGVWAWLTIKYVNANGQSIAKRMLNIKVVRSDGSKASLGRIFWLRNVVNALLAVIPFYGIIDALFIFGETRQCLHDKLADTIVVKA